LELDAWWPHGKDVLKQGFSVEKRGNYHFFSKPPWIGLIFGKLVHIVMWHLGWHGFGDFGVGCMVTHGRDVSKQGFSVEKWGNGQKNWPNHLGLGHDLAHLWTLSCDTLVGMLFVILELDAWWPHGRDVSKRGFSVEKRGKWENI
jgi:hypothetical protein